MKENNKLTHCEDCKKKISRSATVCPNCGKQNPTASVRKNIIIGALVSGVLIVLAVAILPGIMVDQVDREVNSKYYECIERETVKIGNTKKEYIDYTWGGYRAKEELGVSPSGRPYVSYVGKDGAEYKDIRLNIMTKSTMISTPKMKHNYICAAYADSIKYCHRKLIQQLVARALIRSAVDFSRVQAHPVRSTVPD